jgi:hypothetical protein
MALAVTPFVLPPGVLSALAPECRAKAAGGSCALCGMTTAFLHIGSGDVERARSAHAGSLALWILFVMNFIAAAAYLTVALMRKHRNIGGR